jgi:hypothetical protein
MFKRFIAAAAVFVVSIGPVFAKEDCEGGFKKNVGTMSIYINKLQGPDLANAVRQSLDAYQSCTTGDDFSPRGVWDKIIADMQAKAAN